MRTNKYFATDGSETETEPFVGFAVIDISGGISWKLRIANTASTLTA
jgi:hypothetical protein